MNQDNIHKIILFDGVCNLCNGAINFIIKRDKKNVFKFASLQSEVGRSLLSKFNIDTGVVDSIVLIDGNSYYLKSSAALRIGNHLGGFYPLLMAGLILPGFIRDAVYDLVAKNRYKWFGKRESCMLPTPPLKNKFL